jgi:hypothetical protein
LLLSMFAAQGTMLSPLLAVDQVVFTNDGRQQQVDGRILVTAPSGDMLVQGTDGRVPRTTPRSSP